MITSTEIFYSLTIVSDVLVFNHHKLIAVRVGEEYFKHLHDEIHFFVRWFLNVPKEDEVVQLWTKLFGLILESVKDVEANAGPPLETQVDLKKEKQQTFYEDECMLEEKQQKCCCLIL